MLNDESESHCYAVYLKKGDYSMDERYYSDRTRKISGLTLLNTEELLSEREYVRVVKSLMEGEFERTKVSARRGYVSRRASFDLNSGNPLPLIVKYNGTRKDADYVVFLPSHISTRFCKAVYILRK